ncbi:MAG: HEAT repeat domain-containing protein [Anaerolineae bacterium]|nr:HEAT repeat domain-containing protein [Anaerolineae bacterium]
MSLQKSKLLDLVKRYKGKDETEKAAAEKEISQILLYPPGNLVDTIKLMLREDGYREISLGKGLIAFGDFAWQAIMQLGDETNDKDVGWAIAWAISAFTAVCTVDDYLKALTHANVHVRWSAAANISHFNEPRTVDPLLMLFHEPDVPEQLFNPYADNYHAKVRHCAAMSLRKLMNFAFDHIVMKLDDPSPLVRQAVADAFIETTDSRAVEPLLHLLDDSSAVVRKCALEALRTLTAGERDNDVLFHWLISQLHHENQWVQVYAVDPISKYGEDRIPSLLQIANDRDLDTQNFYTRYYALRALKGVIVNNSITNNNYRLLITALTDFVDSAVEHNHLVRMEAAYILAKIDGEDIVSLLLVAMKDDDPYVLQAVLEGIDKRPSSRALTALKALQEKWKDATDAEESRDLPVEDLKWGIIATIEKMSQNLEE